MIPVLPWDTAKAAFKPKPDDEQSRELDRLGFWRSVVGLAVVFFMSVDFRSARDILVDEQGGKVAMNAALGLAAVPVLVGVLFLVSPARFRPGLRAGLRRLLTRIAVAVVTVGVPLVFFSTLDPDQVYDGMPALVILLVVIAASWFLVYFLCVLYWAARTAFWIGEFHPMLSPVAASLIVCVFTVNDLIEWDSNGLPVNTWLIIMGAGVVSTLLLAGAEYRHLARTGIRLTTGPKI
jgi:hypothetical protein